jgi:hypothetical protein
MSYLPNRRLSMTQKIVRCRIKTPFETSKSRIEALASNLYYSISLNKYIMKLQDMPLPISITIDDVMDRDFVIGNLLVADAEMQEAMRISA